MMRGLKIGSVSDSTGAAELTPVVRDFRKLRVELETEGFMDASGLFYTRKMLELVLMLGAGMFLLMAYGRESVLARCLSIVCMSNFFHQCGWTTHDFLHNQVRIGEPFCLGVGTVEIDHVIIRRNTGAQQLRLTDSAGYQTTASKSEANLPCLLGLATVICLLIIIPSTVCCRRWWAVISNQRLR